MNLYERISRLESFAIDKTSKKKLNEGVFKTDGEVIAVMLTYIDSYGLEYSASIPIKSISRFNVYRSIDDKFYGYLYFQLKDIHTLTSNVEEMVESNVICLTAILIDKSIECQIIWSSRFEKVGDNSYIVLFIGNEEKPI